MSNVIDYGGKDEWKIKATELLNQGGGGGGGNVDDVKVNGTSVVDANKVAQIDLTPYAETEDLATVATSGSYNDLSNKPSIPAAQVNSDWNASSGVAQILNKPNLATVATSGSYTDLSNKPTIPPTLSSSGNIEIDSNVITRKEVWLTMAEYTALSSPDADTDYHITDGTLPYQISVSDVEVDGVSVVANNVANITNKVSRTGDTMTGNLAIEKNTPQVSEMDTRTTLDTSSNNGVTSNRITASLILIDSNGNSLGRLLNEARTDGSVRTYLQAFNMKTNGDLAYNTFWLGVTKSGENVYYIANPSAFRSAIGIEPTSTTTGTNGGTVRRWGNIVSINFQGTIGSNMGSVPSGYRPQSAAERTIIYVEKYNGSTLTNRYYALLAVESNGNISCSYVSSYGGTSFPSAKDANHKIYGNITYVIADND